MSKPINSHRGHQTTTAARPPLQYNRNPLLLDQDTIVPLLARRSYHLPGNTWCADWCQWFGNNHILFGICLHHPWHPLEWWERCLALTASVSFGLTTNLLVYYYYSHVSDRNDIVLNLYDTYAITQSMVTLWTVGGVSHNMFDMAVWYIMACACCQPGGRLGQGRMSQKCRDVGSYMLIPVIVALLGFAIFLVLLRATHPDGSNNTRTSHYFYDDDQQQNQQQQDDNWFTNPDVDVDQIKGLESFSFLQRYVLELILVWCVYFPLFGIILFSGCLGCNGQLPILGGRPRDVRIVAQELAEKLRTSSTRTNASDYYYHEF
ncbi:hypothetical protein ACA910_012279 [Epithemia clementina (nom. ined.)]